MAGVIVDLPDALDPPLSLLGAKKKDAIAMSPSAGKTKSPSQATGGRRLTPYWGFKGRGWDDVAMASKRKTRRFRSR
jgi:hypothetical protein